MVNVDVAYGGANEIILRGILIDHPFFSDSLLIERTAGLPGKAEIISLRPKVVIRVRMPGEIGTRKIPWLNIVLFVLTLFSTIIVGASFEDVNVAAQPGLLWQNPLLVLRSGIPFSFSLLAILLCHEFGHYIASRRNGVRVTLPYFVPFPNFIGTLGAVIRSKSPFITRRQLLDVGATGPLSGMAIAIPLIIWGMAHPKFIPDTASTAGMVNLGNSLLFGLIDILISPQPPVGFMAIIHPVAFAGWVGFLVTMLNLMPIGQLDGGHILYAMFGKVQHKLAYLFIFVLVALSFLWMGWFIWIIFGFLLRPAHPPTIMDEIPLDNRRKLIGYICIAVFILCFIPVPFSIR